MINRIILSAALTACAAPVVYAQAVHAQGPAPRLATQLPAGEQQALDAIRRDVWVNWFRGDTAALRRVLGPELVAISTGSAHWQSLDESIAGSASYVSGGGKFVSVAFDSTLAHRFGETVVMFAHYTLVTERGGQRSTQHGRATEVFVRDRGRWVHTSWHLDREPPPTP